MKKTSLLLTLIVSLPVIADHNDGIVIDTYGKVVGTGHGGCLLFGNPEPGLCASMLSGGSTDSDMTRTAAPAAQEPAEVSDQPVIKRVINLKGVSFKTGSDELLASSNARLDSSARELIDNPEIRVIVAGHTDNVGDPAFNMRLSEKRAQAVRNYLIAKGVDEDRMTAVGFGDSEPDAPNETAEGRAKNRRVELRVIE